MNRLHLALASSIVTSSLCAQVALAQAPAAPVAPAAAPAPTAPYEAAPVAAPAPAPEPVAAAPAPVAVAPAAPPPAAEAEPESDHDAMVGHLAVGYLGLVNVPYGFLLDNLGNTYPDAQMARAPVVGIRYWFNPTLGLDAGVGFTTTFGNNSVPDANGATVSTDANAPTAFALHGGLPISFAAAKHYSFQLIPEMNFASAQAAIPNGDASGMHFDVGARVGSEIHFGFIGIPQLALQGSVGLRIDVNQTKDEVTLAGVTTKATSTRTVVGTTVNNNPWDIFLGNISALYYL